MSMVPTLLTLALLGLLYLGGVTLAYVWRLSAQLAVLTIRVTDLVEQIDTLSPATREGER